MGRIANIALTGVGLSGAALGGVGGGILLQQMANARNPAMQVAATRELEQAAYSPRDAVEGYQGTQQPQVSFDATPPTQLNFTPEEQMEMRYKLEKNRNKIEDDYREQMAAVLMQQQAMGVI